jgi:hypothetical protein
MKSAAALLAAAVLCSSTTACDSTSKGAGPRPQLPADAAVSAGTRTTAAPRATPAGGYLKNDADDDGDEKHRQPNDNALFLATYGKRADQADMRAVTALIKRYYATAAAGDGAKACPLLYSTLATGLTEGQGHSVRSASKACAAIVSRLLEQQHERLAGDDVATMVVVDVHVKGDLGVAVLGFRTVPMSTMLLKRERGAWKIDALFDSEIT